MNDKAMEKARGEYFGPNAEAGWPEQRHFDAGFVAGYAAANQWTSIEDRPKVVCFCGSTRFTNEMLILQWEFAKRGEIVHTWHALPRHALPPGYAREAHVAEAEGCKEALDELHKRKIDLSDEVFVINLNGYIGESTRSEIEYAESIGKPVNYLEPLPVPEGERK